ncbi:MAG: phosphoglycerate kinase [Spirochaetia bacterium]|jgi:phosphoglycerate kinase|nr:phosphoglycerate kinase [Spirochaetia bacterium]
MSGLGFASMEDMEVKGRRVLLRCDINSPIDPETKRIVNENRLDKTVPTLRWLLEQGARVGIIAHQGDTLDYQDLIPMAEHAQKLSQKLGRPVAYIDDVCGPAAIAKVEALEDGEAVLLGNLRYLTEEVSVFETVVKLEPEQMAGTYLVRSLAPHFDLYVNEAFSAAHRKCPSMVAFQRLLPSAAGPLFFREVSTLTRIMEHPAHPSTFVLGGAKISDAFGMMGQVLKTGSADRILTCGVTGEVFLMAGGKDLGGKMMQFLSDRGLLGFVDEAKDLLGKYGGKIEVPEDLAYECEGKRQEIGVADLPVEEDFIDIGQRTIARYRKAIAGSGTVFVNGPAGIYEKAGFEDGTRELWKAMEESRGFTVIGGGDSVTAAARFTDMSRIGYICTAGGAMVRFLSGKKLPLIEAMEHAKR